MKLKHSQLVACFGLLGLVLIPTNNVQGDVLAHWTFDETAGATTLVDSVNGFNGAAVGASAGATGQIGGAWTFDNSTQDYIDLTSVSSNFTGLTQGTISVWINSTVVSGTNQRKAIISAYDSTQASTESLLFLENSVRYDTRDGSASLPGEGGLLRSPSSYNDGNWHHVAVAFNAGGVPDSMYVDGVLVETEDEPFFGDITTAIDGMAIGRNVDSGGGQWYFPGLIDDIQIYDNPLPDFAVQKIYDDGVLGISTEVTGGTALSVQVDSTTGLVSLRNDTAFDISIDSYQLGSSASSLSPTGWSSFEDQDLEGAGPGSGWTELAAASNELTEAILGDYMITSNSILDLGLAFDTGIGQQDLAFEYHLQSAGAGAMTAAEVTYTSSNADFDGDGSVTGSDFLTLQRGLGLTGQVDNSNGDANGDGVVDSVDLSIWELTYGTSPGPLATSQAVPEPSSLLLLGIGAVAIGFRRIRQTALVLMLACLFTSTASADAFKERQYLLGDDPLEAAVANNTVGSGASGSTFDSVGVNLTAFPGAIDTGAYQDLSVGGAPTYVDVSTIGGGRPGAGVGDTLGARFNGSSDRLSQSVSVNAPSQMWDRASFWPEDLINGGYDVPSLAGTDTTGDGLYTPAYPHNMESLFATANQVWVYPEGSENGHGEREDILRDASQKGLFITDTDDGGADGGPDMWGHHYRGQRVSETPVVRNQWTHVQQLATGGISVLYVDGIAVDAVVTFFGSSALELSVGSDLSGAGNFYEGVLDNLEIAVVGDSSFEVPTATNTELGYLGGADWGGFVLAEDNDYVAQQLVGIPEADVDMDGDVDGDDITAFIPFWLEENEIDGITIGDLNSRSEGDLNFDGITDLDDAILLREGLKASPLGVDFDLSILFGVPEPSSLMLCCLGSLSLILRSRRNTAAV